jgi:hypothetical protein
MAEVLKEAVRGHEASEQSVMTKEEVEAMYAEEDDEEELE